jgi:hypothetical protein
METTSIINNGNKNLDNDHKLKKIQIKMLEEIIIFVTNTPVLNQLYVPSDLM